MVDLETLLALPDEEKKEIAEKLWGSLPPASDIDLEEEAIIELLDDRWKKLKEGKTKVYSSEEVKALFTPLKDKQ